MALRNTRGADVPLAWSRVASLKYPEEAIGVACAHSFCLAVSNTRIAAATFASKVYRSTDDGATWSHGVALGEDGAIKTRSAQALACDPAGTCYAVGPAGGVWRSADQGRNWEALSLPPKPASYRRVACPADGTCVAVGGDSDGSSAVIEGKKVTPVELPRKSGGGILGLACDTRTRCTATDDLGHFMSLSIPKKEWGAAKLFPEAKSVSALACPAEDVCVGLEAGGPEALRTTSLTTGDWQQRPLGSAKLEGIACAHTACVAVGKAGGWFASFDAGDEWARVNEVGKFDAIQCSAALRPTCVAGGEKDLGVSRSGGKLWSLPLSGYSGLNIKSLKCTAPSQCLFLGKNQTLFTSDLVSYSPRQATTTDPMGTDALSCITQALCVGISEGVVYTTLDGGLTGWGRNSFPKGRATSVACLAGRTSPATCVATTRKFIELGTMTQSGGAVSWRWVTTHAQPPKGLEAVGCSPGGECTAAGPDGEVLTSHGKDLMDWSLHVLPGSDTPVAERPLLKSVACPADGVCLAGGMHGPFAIIASTANHWDDFSYDKIQGIEGAMPTIASFGCETVDRCVAVGSTALIGVRKR